MAAAHRNRVRLRPVLWQGGTLVLVIALGAWLVGNLLDNLAARGIASGFGFLDTTAGFGIGFSLIDYTEESTYGRAFFVGLLNTLLVSAIGIVGATVLGFAIGLGRLSSNWLVARICGAYVEIIRNLPLLLQIFFWYFAVVRSLPPPRGSLEALWGVVVLNNRGLYVPSVDLGLVFLLVVALVFMLVRFRRYGGEPDMLKTAYSIFALVGVTLVFALLLDWEVDWPELQGFNYVGGWVLIPELVALVVALATYTAAFIAEIVRAGVLSVDRGQIEAARALGLPRRTVTREIVVPQALRVIVPPLTNQYLNLTKNSSLAAAIAYPELVSVFAGTVLNQTGQAVEVIAITMAVYLAISLAISLGMNLYNRTTALKGAAPR